jgi:hypothetical protein
VPLTLRKFIAIVVLVISLVLSSSAVYSAYFYFGVYRAVRVLDATLQSFDIELLNATYGQMKIKVTVSNPSEYSFIIGEVTQLIYLNSEPFGSDLWFGHPTKIESQSSVNMSHTMPISENMVQSMAGVSHLEWLVELNLQLSGPLVGGFALGFELYPD